MAWTAPRTWVHDEIVTAAMMNAHVRDNELVLKTTRDAQGRVSALSSATLGDASGTNLTGVAKLAADNAYTGGRHRFVGSSRVVVPVGADKWTGTKGVDAAGSVWVEGDHLHHIAQDQTTERQYLGEFVSTPAGALAGSMWVEGEYLHYVDADGDERRCRSAGASSAHADAAAMAGSLWAETYVHWVMEGGTHEKPGHADVAHADGTVHNDTHGDTAHSDVHTDVGHADSHGDGAHSDVAHSDIHEDVHGDFQNPDDNFHGDAHEDAAHHDVAHGDSHTDDAHDDSHTDTVHSDSHNDHGDHGDAAHADQPVVVP